MYFGERESEVIHNPKRLKFDALGVEAWGMEKIQERREGNPRSSTWADIERAQQLEVLAARAFARMDSEALGRIASEASVIAWRCGLVDPPALERKKERSVNTCKGGEQTLAATPKRGGPPEN